MLLCGVCACKITSIPFAQVISDLWLRLEYNWNYLSGNFQDVFREHARCVLLNPRFCKFGPRICCACRGLSRNALCFQCILSAPLCHRHRRHCWRHLRLRFVHRSLVPHQCGGLTGDPGLHDEAWHATFSRSLPGVFASCQCVFGATWCQSP